MDPASWMYTADKELSFHVKIRPFFHCCISQNLIVGSPQKFSVEQIEIV